MTSDKKTPQLIDEFLEYLEIEKNCSPLTIRDYRHYLSRFLKWFSPAPTVKGVKNIDLETVRKYRVYLSRFTHGQGSSLSTLSKATQSYHVIALRSFLRWLVKNDYETLSPEKIELPKIESRSLKFLDAGQLERLLSQPDITKIRGLRDKAIMEMLFSTGLRVSELTKLNKDMINLERREFGVIGKGGRSRVVLSDRACEWLQKYLDDRTDSFKPLFIHFTDKIDPAESDEKQRLTPRTVQRIVEKYVKKAKLPIKITPHGLRHSFATDLLMAGADIRSVQEMLGHKNISTTQIYTHVTNKQLKEIHENFHGKSR
jgi:site-specific recombinase XerD